MIEIVDAFYKDPSSIKIVDLARELSVDIRRMLNWVARDQIPVDLEKPGQGAAVRVKQCDVERLAVFLIVASVVGPNLANVSMEENDHRKSKISIDVACVTVLIDLMPVREAILRANKKAWRNERHSA